MPSLITERGSKEVQLLLAFTYTVTVHSSAVQNTGAGLELSLQYLCSARSRELFLRKADLHEQIKSSYIKILNILNV